MMINEYGAVGGMRNGRGKPKYSEKAIPIRPPQIPHNLTGKRTWEAAVGYR
jgi:hypothetical protein